MIHVRPIFKYHELGGNKILQFYEFLTSVEIADLDLNQLKIGRADILLSWVCSTIFETVE